MTREAKQVALATVYVKFRAETSTPGLRRVARIALQQLRNAARKHISDLRPEIRVTVERGSVVTRGGAYATQLRVRDRLVLSRSFESSVADIDNRSREFAREARQGIVERVDEYSVERSRVNGGLPSRLSGIFTYVKQGELAPEEAVERILKVLGLDHRHDRAFQSHLLTELRRIERAHRFLGDELAVSSGLSRQVSSVFANANRAMRSAAAPRVLDVETAKGIESATADVRGVTVKQDNRGRTKWGLLY